MRILAAFPSFDRQLDPIGNIIKISSIKAKPLSEHLPAELWSSFSACLEKEQAEVVWIFLSFEFCLCFCSIANAMAQVLQS